MPNPIIGSNRFKFGLFNANCDGGFAISTAPERWRCEWDGNCSCLGPVIRGQLLEQNLSCVAEDCELDTSGQLAIEGLRCWISVKPSVPGRHGPSAQAVG